MKYIIYPLLFVLVALTFNVNSKQPDNSSQFKRELLESINHTRASGCTCGVTYMPPAPPVVWNDKLEKAAMGHARDMAKHDYFSHTSRDGRSTMARVEDAGYTHNGFRGFTVGENIAQGQQSIAEVMEGWFKSEGHCKNLMNPDFKEVGVAEHDTYWVQDFGGRVSFSPEMQEMIKSGKVKLIRRSSPAQ
jgi:uncharacterized protein YkwD